MFAKQQLVSIASIKEMLSFAGGAIFTFLFVDMLLGMFETESGFYYGSYKVVNAPYGIVLYDNFLIALTLLLFLFYGLYLYGNKARRAMGVGLAIGAIFTGLIIAWRYYSSVMY